MEATFQTVRDVCQPLVSGSKSYQTSEWTAEEKETALSDRQAWRPLK